MRIWAIGLLALLSACSQQAMNERLSTAEERAFAAQMVQVVQAGDMRQVVDVSDPETMRDFSPRILAQVHALTPGGQAELKAVAVNEMTADGQTRTFKTFNYELGAGRRWAILQIILHPAGGKIWLAGIYVQPADRSPSAAYDFSFAGKGLLHHLWLVAMVWAVGISLTACVLIFRTRGLQLKWLWLLGSLFSFVTFWLDWSTGAWSIQPISFLLLGAAGMRAGPFAPWIFGFAIPAVAIVFLLLRALGVLAQEEAQDPKAG